MDSGVEGRKVWVSVHDGFHNKTRPRRPKQSRDDGWLSGELSFDGLIAHISLGHAWTACELGPADPQAHDLSETSEHQGGAWRHESTADRWNLIVLDVDGDLSLEEFWSKPLVQRHCLCTYTTCSHSKSTGGDTQGPDRYRAIFQADAVYSEQQDPGLHHGLYHQWLDHLGLELTDNSGEKAERLWYGNSNTQVRFGQGQPLPWDLIEAARDRAASAETATFSAPSGPIDAADQQRGCYALRHVLRESCDGEYTTYWLPVFQAAASDGSEDMLEAFLEWNSRGHHRKRNPSSSIQRRWHKSGQRSTVGVLIKLAKEQARVSSWNDIPGLPEHLRYRHQILAPQVLASSFKPGIVGNSTGFATPEPTAPPQVPASSDPTASSNHPLTPTGRSCCSREDGSLSPLALPSDFRKGAERDAPLSADEQILRQLRQLYLLATHGMIADSSGNLWQVPAIRTDSLDLQIRSELAAYREIQRSNARITRAMESFFRREHGLINELDGEIKVSHPDGSASAVIHWLIPGLLIRSMDHVLFSKPGRGKTSAALQIARSLIGDPTMGSFLDIERPSAVAHWRQRRVLYIASDGGETAKDVINTYIRESGSSGADWLQYLDLIAQDSRAGSKLWNLTLSNLAWLFNYLQRCKDEGCPVTCVVIDTMKSILEGTDFLVGDQALAHYLKLVQDICLHHGASLLWLHHEAKGDSGAQGIASITERPSGVFRLTEEDGQSLFVIEKLRGSAPRKIPYTFTKSFEFVAQGTTPVDDDDSRLVTLFRDHYQRHALRVAHLPADDAQRRYIGLKIRDVEASITMPRRTIQRRLSELVDDGTLMRQGHLYRLAEGLRSPTAVDQLGLSAETDIAGF